MQPGDFVRIGANDARVKPGRTGRFLRVVEETGCLLIDVDGRGPVAFTEDSVMAMDGAAATVAQRTNGIAPAAQPEREKLRLSRPLYLDAIDTAAELGCTVPQLKTLAELVDVGTCRGKGRSCHYTAREIALMIRFRAFMKRTHTKSPVLAYSILAEVRELTGRDPLAPE